MKIFLGLATMAGGLTVSFLEKLEITLRIATLSVSLVVGVLTIASLIKKLKHQKKPKAKHNEQ